MKTLKPMAVAPLCVAATTVVAQEPAWNASAIKECDRACLVGILDGYLDALFKRDPKAVPALSLDVRMTENTGQMDAGEQPSAFFVHDGTRRGAPADAPPGMLQNLVTMETFSVRGGLIHHVEAAPFVTLAYGLGNGWTSASGR